MLVGLQKLLTELRAERAIVIDDLIEGLSIEKIKIDLAALEMGVPNEVVEFWRMVGGTRQPKGTNPQFQEKYRLDQSYIYYSPLEACNQFWVIQNQKKQGFEDFSTFPNTCLPIACSIFGEILSIECDKTSSLHGQVFNFDPPTGEHTKVSTSLNSYFQTVHAAFNAKIIKLDENSELDIDDFDAYFGLATRMNPECDFWTS